MSVGHYPTKDYLLLPPRVTRVSFSTYLQSKYGNENVVVYADDIMIIVPMATETSEVI